MFKVLKPYAAKLRRVGHEAGSLSPWLQVELKQRGLPAICVEAWHARAALSAMRNKTDKADARGIAHIMRTGWFREVHVKSDASYRLRLLLTQRRNLKRKFLDIENAIRHSNQDIRAQNSAGLVAANSRRGCASWWQMIR